MATCEHCQCSYSVHWGGHHCAAGLPAQPKEFTEQVKAEGGLMPSCDFWDRKAWLQHVAEEGDKDWRKVAKGYRKAAEARAVVALAEEALKRTVV